MKTKTLLSIYFLTALLFAAYALSNYNAIETYKKELDAQKEFYKSQELNGVDLKLIEAVIAVESSGRSYVVSNAGAVGLMQVLPRYWLAHCGLKSKNELFDPKKNVDCGSKVLSHYLEKENGNIRKALERYHGGYSVGAKSKAYALKVLFTYQNLI